MWRSSLWSISWLRHQMFYPYVTISAAQAHESDDLRHAMSPFSLFLSSFSGTQRILGYVRPWRIVAVRPLSDWDRLHVVLWCNWPSNAPLKDADLNWDKLVFCLVITKWKSIKLKSDFHLLPFLYREILVFLVTLVYRWVHPFSRNVNLNDSPTFLCWLPGCWGTSDDFLSLCVLFVQGPRGTDGTKGGPGGKGSKGQEVRHSTPGCFC